MEFKLICLDMDGVIFKPANFWLELHKAFGTFEQGKRLTETYLHTDYNRLVEEVVVKLWKGRDAKPYLDLINSTEYTGGVKEFFDFVKKKGYITAIISSGSIDLAKRVQKDFGTDHVFANELAIRDGKISGEFLWPIGAGNHKKAEIMRDLCRDLGISTKECIYIGDSSIDAEAFKEAGFAIAFNSGSEELKKAADAVVDSDNLADVIEFLK